MTQLLTKLKKVFQKKDTSVTEQNDDEKAIADMRALQDSEQGGFWDNVVDVAPAGEKRDYLKSFMPYIPPPGVVNPAQNVAKINDIYKARGDNKSVKLSDEVAKKPIGIQGAGKQIAAIVEAGGFAKGFYGSPVGFMGYQQLGMMLEVPELRKPCDVLSDEMVREWVEIRYDERPDDKSNQKAKKKQRDRVQQLEQAFEDFHIKDLMRKFVWDGHVYGVGHIFIDAGDVNPQDPGATAQPLDIDGGGIAQGKLRGFRTIDPIWCTPTVYNAQNPLLDDWYRPVSWWCQSNEVHNSRLLHIVPYPVSDFLKPSRNFGGESLIQLLSESVGQFRQLKASMTHSSVAGSWFCYGTDMMSQLGPANRKSTAGIRRDLAIKSSLARTFQVLPYNKNSDEIQTFQFNTAQYVEPFNVLEDQQATISSIPRTKLFGQGPNGMNASSEGEMDAFFDGIHAKQEALLRTPLEAVTKCLMLHLWGEIDDSIKIDFNSLHQSDPLDDAQIQKTKAETMQILDDAGVVTPDENRMALADDPDSIYATIGLTGDAPEKEDEDPDLDEREVKDIRGDNPDKETPDADVKSEQKQESSGSGNGQGSTKGDKG